MTPQRTRKAVVAASVAAGIVVGAGAAMAASTVVTDTDNTHLRIVKSEFEDGFSAGWHTHPGPAIVQVQRGYFKLYQGSCAPTVVGPGETFVEVPNVPVRGEAKGPISWTTTFLYESGRAPSTPAGDPCS